MAMSVVSIRRVGSMWYSSSAFLSLSFAPPSSLEGSSATVSPPSPGAPRPVIPESDQGLTFGGFMELMAVPKTKISPHKRRLRNGPKALKPVPVIVRCETCEAVKLPHFYCCSGERGAAAVGRMIPQVDMVLLLNVFLHQ